MAADRFDLLVVGELNPDAIVAGEAIEPGFRPGRAARRCRHARARRLGRDRRQRRRAARPACRPRRAWSATTPPGASCSTSFASEASTWPGAASTHHGAPASPSRSAAATTGRCSRLPARSRALPPRRRATRRWRQARTCTSRRSTCRPACVTALRELLRARAPAGATTSLDPGWDPPDEWAEGLDAALAATDVFLPNAAEACRIAGATTPSSALDRLSARVPTVAVKLGERGAIARRGDERAAADATRGRPGRRHGRGRQLRGRVPPRPLDGLPLAETLQPRASPAERFRPARSAASTRSRTSRRRSSPSAKSEARA